MKALSFVAAILLLTSLTTFAETEPNNTMQQANNLAYNGNESGSLTGADTEDWFVVNLPQGGIFTLTVKKTGGGYAFLYLYDGEKGGNPEIRSINLPFGDSPAQGWTITAPLLSGKYYVKILKTADPVDYQISASLAAPAFAEDKESNDTVTQAVVIHTATSITGNLHYYGAGEGYDMSDWYRLELAKGGILNLKIHKKGPGNSWLRFRDGVMQGKTEITNYYFSFNETPAGGDSWSYPVLAGTYYFQVEGGGNVVDYKLEISLLDPAFPEDAEPDDTITRALVMPVSGSVSGNVHYYTPGKGYDSQDWYKLVVPRGGILNLKIQKKGAGNSWLRFRDGMKNGQPEISSYYFQFWETTGEGDKWSYPVLAGTYYFQVEGGGNVVDYQLDVSLADPAFTEDAEPNDTITRALVMPVDGTVSGMVHYYQAGKEGDPGDWYRLDVPRGGFLNLKIDKKGPGNTWFYFLDGIKSGQPKISEFYFNYSESPAEGWKWSYPVLKGTYFFQVEGGGGVVDYRMETKLDVPVWGEDTENNDSLRFAQIFALNDSVAGLLGYYKPGQGTDNWDWFVINTTEFGYLSFHVVKKGLQNGNIRLRDTSNEITSQYLSFGDLETTWGRHLPAGTYYLGLEKFGGDIQYKTSMRFIPKPKADFTWTKGDNSFTFENTSTHGESYSWDFNDGQKATTVHPFHEYKAPGNYKVCLIAKNITGSDTACHILVLPGISRIFPEKGGNTGDVSVEIFGGGLDTMYLAKIMLGNTLVAQSDLTRISGYSSILVRFDLRNKPVGTFDVVIEKPGGPSYRLNGSFAIETGTKADPWVTVSGRNRILFNTWTTYTVNYGNRGNVDAKMAPVWLAFSRSQNMEIDFKDVKIYDPDSTVTNLSDGLFVDLDSLFGQPYPARIYPLLIPLIPGQSVKSFIIRVKSGDNIKINAWTEIPWYQSPINEAKTECLADALSEAPPEMNLTSDKVFCFKMFTVIIMDKEMDAHSYDVEHGYVTGDFPFISTFTKVIRATAKICGINSPDDRKKISDWVVNIMLRHWLEKIPDSDQSGHKSASADFSQCKIEFKPQNEQTMTVTAVSSLDPNEKSGPSGFGVENYISATRTIPYTIYFENKPTATAPAHIITITDQLDKTKFDISTFSFGNITVGDSIIYVKSGQKEFVIDKKIDKLKVIARISGKLDTLTGNLEWKLRSLDPVTFDDIEDPDIGLLPPNKTSPEGQGSVSFFVRLKSDPTHKSTVTNQASIVFDANPAIITNKHLTTFDLAAPQSMVQSLTASTTDRQFTVKWSGTDDGSGIGGYNIYVKKDNDPYHVWLAGTMETSAVYKSLADGTFQFASVAVDQTGNTEVFPSTPDASTNVVTKAEKATRPGQEIRVYPIPTAQELVVNIGVEGRFILRIYGTDGRIRMEKQLAGHSVTPISTGSLPRGLYLWQVVSKDSSLRKTGKISVTE